MERILDQSMSSTGNSVILGDIGLPTISKAQRDIFKTIRSVRRSNNKLKKNIIRNDNHIKSRNFEFSPSSPLKMTQYDRRKLVPFHNLHKKSYFKTIEHLIQNANNHNP